MGLNKKMVSTQHVIISSLDLYFVNKHFKSDKLFLF